MTRGARDKRGAGAGAGARARAGAGARAGAKGTHSEELPEERQVQGC